MATPIDTMTKEPASRTGRKTGFGSGATSLSRSSRLKLAIGSLIVLAIAAAGWTTMNWVRSANKTANIVKYSVAPQSFSVLLKEKGELKAAKSTEIVSKVEGRSTIISLIPEGTAVKKGDLLIELASEIIDNRIQQDELKEANAITAFEAAKTELDIQRDKNESDIRKAQLRIELTQLALEKYEKGDWTQTIKDAKIAIEQAKITLERRKQDFMSAKELRERGFITQTEYEEDEFNHQKAIWDLEKAEKAKDVLIRYTHVAELRQKQSDLEESNKEFERTKKNAAAEETKKVRSVEGKQKELELIRDQLTKLRTQKKNCTIYAPTQGFVVYYTGGGRHFFMSGDNQIREGATVHERQILLSLPDTTQMMVVVRVHEAKTDKLEIGQRVILKVEGIPDQQFTGNVTKIAVLADSQNRWLNPDLKEYETEITLDPTDVPLKPGATTYAEIIVENVDERMAIPVQAIYNKNARRYVFLSRGNRVNYTEVELGAIGTEWAEVTQGLTPGDDILLAFGDDEKRMIPNLKIDKRGSKLPGKGMKRSHKQIPSVSPPIKKHRGNYSKDHTTKSTKLHPSMQDAKTSPSHQGS